MSDAVQHADLIALLRGELERDELAAAVGRLRASEEARRELVDAVAVHASLSAAARVLGGGSGRQAVEQPLPTAPPRARRGRRRNALAVAAAVVVLAGGAGTWLGARASHEQPALQPPARAVALRPVAGTASGEVTMAEDAGRRTRMSVTTAGLPVAAAGHFYYAWLLDPRTDKMLPLGTVAAGGDNRFEVADDIVARYHAVDVSLQDDDGDPRHSATSVLRASY